MQKDQNLSATRARALIHLVRTAWRGHDQLVHVRLCELDSAVGAAPVDQHDFMSLRAPRLQRREKRRDPARFIEHRDDDRESRFTRHGSPSNCS